jgi:hypothetical protein
MLDQGCQLAGQQILIDIGLIAQLEPPLVIQQVGGHRGEPLGVLLADGAHRPQPHRAVDDQIAARGQGRHLDRLRQTDLLNRGLQALLKLLGAPGPAQLRTELELIGVDLDEVH